MSSDRRPVLLFQGDSITDANRRRNGAAPNQSPSLGTGYALIAASAVLADEPATNWSVYNRGVGGDTVRDLTDRWDTDALALTPDVLSILVGVNDYWYLRADDRNSTPERYEQAYRALLDRTRTAVPGVSLLLGEPFVLPGGTGVNEEWREGLRPYRDAARRIATDYDATWIPYQSVFDDAIEDAPGPYWAEDGIHPTPAGHARMADAWLTAFRDREL